MDSATEEVARVVRIIAHEHVELLDTFERVRRENDRLKQEVLRIQRRPQEADESESSTAPEWVEQIISDVSRGFGALRRALEENFSSTPSDPETPDEEKE